MKNLKISFIFLLIGLLPVLVIAEPVIYIEVCLNQNVTVLTNNQYKVGSSDGVCSSGTHVYGGMLNDPNYPEWPDGYPFEPAGVEVERTSDYYTNTTIKWQPGWEGTVRVTVYYQTYTYKFPTCGINSPKPLLTYEITRKNIVPQGVIAGDLTPTYTDNPDTFTPFNFKFMATPFTTNQIRYWNGVEYVTNNIDLGQIIDLTYYAKGYGKHELATQLQNSCGSWFEGPSQSLYLYPTCQGKSGEFKLDPGEYTVYDDGYRVTPNKTYSFVPPDIRDFDRHYTIVHNGGEDITLSGNTFTVHKELGSYKIEAVLKEGRGDYCNPVAPMVIFTGGSNINPIEQPCPIVLPIDLAGLGFNVAPGEPALKHFKGTVKSKKSIVVKPGIVLTEGAELVLDYTSPAPDRGDPDKNINYVQHISRNEYGEIISATRQYFDAMGRPTQVQAKNLSGEVVLATETLYDAYGRPVVQTLPAPVSASSLEYVIDECGDNVLTGEDMQFNYKENFVTDITGSPYDHTHFDLHKNGNNEETPVSVGSAEEGTLGWYYSENNGTSTDNPRYNEPLTPITGYPYSRTLFHRDGSGEVKGVAGPGEAHYAGSGHVAAQNSQPVENSDLEMMKYFEMGSKVPGHINTTKFKGNFFRSTYTDENGRKSISYLNKGGNTLISLYYGEGTIPTARSYQFYDAAGRLIVSVSPKGVAEYDGSNFANIAKTTYQYNYKGWLVSMQEPDAGETKYLYRKDGRIRFSENALQREEGTYSYTNYDRAGRPIASGAFMPNLGGVAFGSEGMKNILESEALDGGLPEGAGIRQYEVITGYDSPMEIPGGRTQRFVMGNVSYSQNDHTTTWYSYDDLGRVEWIVQDIAGLGIKTVDYRYGPEGNVQEVAYQKGDPMEEFYHYYTYDADGRLKEAYTSIETLEYNLQGELVDPSVLKLQAIYEYYLHGPLKRIVLAEDLQGIDYTYAINGALKAINHADPAMDPGQDGLGNGRRKDVFGMSLEYHPNDYKSAAFSPGAVVAANVPDLYDGNVRAQSWHSAIDGHEPRAYAYNYDQRYQLLQADWGSVVPTGTDYSFVKAGNGAYQESIGKGGAQGYDANGNIQSLLRVDGVGDEIADYDYEYKPYTNQLQAVLHGGIPFLEYEYNAIGQMVKQTEGDKDIHVSYDVTGKVTEVTAIFPDEMRTQKMASFTYDDRGFRLSKTSYDEEGNETLTTWYVRDASGHVLSIYNQEAASTVEQTELPVYGSGRIGLYRPHAYLGKYLYEMNDHLGNVRAVIGEGITVEYLATMESDPEVQGNESYFNSTPGIPTAEYINHTPAVVMVDGRSYTIDNPNKVVRINNAKDSPQKIVGSSIGLPVYPGDKISAEVFSKYINFEKDNINLLPGLAALLSSSFGLPAPVDGMASVFDSYVNELGALAALGEINEDVPRAFLNYILFDKNFIMTGFGVVQVSEAAAIPGEDPFSHPHERLSFDGPITVQEEGFIYIFVSNDDGQDMDVYFDDFRVTHEYGDIVAGGDHYPFGLAMDGRQVTREPYRYGYQGQFSEKDEETGWNSFEARQWDARIGRWLSVDPSRQYYSSYLGMDNNPVIGVDPDGRFSRFGAWWRSKFISNSYTYNTGTEWAVGWDTWENDGQGAYLLGHSITEGGPGISGNYKLDFITTANATYKFGFNQVLDQGLVGFSADMGSLEAVKFNIDPQKFDGNNMSDIMEWQTPNNLTQGIRVETPYGDVKYKLNFDPSTGNLKTLEVGIGAPFIEAKVILDHNGVHTIRLGSQEDIGRSVNGHALTIDYFTGLSFHRKR